MRCDEGFEVDPASANLQPACTATGSLTSDIKCVELSSPCASDPCENESFCIQLTTDRTQYRCCDDNYDDPLSFQCMCPPGFANSQSYNEDGSIGAISYNCDFIIDYCASEPCQGSASTCSQETDAYSCTCEPGLQGFNCAEEANECDSDPCGISNLQPHGSSCDDLIGSYRCECVDGWFGENCQDEDVCVRGTDNCGDNTHCEIAAHLCPTSDPA